MKMLLLISIFLIVLFSCGLINESKNIESFIPGTYIRFSSHEYGKVYDTVVMILQNETAHEFKIVRKWKYERILDGQAMEPDYKIEISTGIYHSADKVLQDSESGSLYSFDPEEKILFNGDIKYKKL